jgi:hypothetical protein
MIGFADVAVALGALHFTGNNVGSMREIDTIRLA